MAWCVSNAVVARDRKRQHLPHEETTSRGQIDPLMAAYWRKLATGPPSTGGDRILVTMNDKRPPGRRRLSPGEVDVVSVRVSAHEFDRACAKQTAIASACASRAACLAHALDDGGDDDA